MSQDLLILIILTFLTGLIVKYVDVLEDDRKNSSLSLKITLGMLYGILLFYTVRRFDVIASLWIGTVIGLILTGKIDSPGHYAGVGLFFVLLLLLGFSNVNFLLLILLASFSWFHFVLYFFISHFISYLQIKHNPALYLMLQGILHC